MIISQKQWTALACVLSLAAIWLATPAPEYFLRNADSGIQLAGAQEIAYFGGMLGRSFDHTSGFLRFGVSALAQLLAGKRLIGELILSLVGYATAYTMLYTVALRMGARPWFAAGSLAMALLLMPRYHRYYVVLLPAAMLFTTQLWTRRPHPRNLFGMAAVVALATFFRHDYGAFCFCVGGVVLALEKSSRVRLKHIAVFTALSFGFIAVGYLWLVGPGGIIEYIADLVTISGSQSRGMSLPHPLLHYANWRLSLAFAGFYLAAAGLLWLAIAKHSRFKPAEARLLIGWAVLGTVCLVQTSHRADLSHLLQGVPVLVMSLAILDRLLHQPGVRGWQRSVAGLTALCLTVAVLLSAAENRSMWRRPDSSWKSFSAASLRPVEMAASAEASPWGRLATRIHSCTVEAEPLIIWPFSPQLHYFSDRPFGSRLPNLGPGFFDSYRQQTRALKQLEESPPRLILWDINYAYDGLAERRSTATHPLIYAFVQRAYRVVGQYQVGTRSFTVWANRQSDSAADAARCVLNY